MATLALNDDGSLLIEANNLVWATGADEVATALTTNLRSFLGEWFLDESLGVPWKQLIFQKGTPPDLVASALKVEIVQTKGVRSLNSFEMDIDRATRKLTVTVSVTAFTGEELELEEEFG